METAKKGFSLSTLSIEGFRSIKKLEPLTLGALNVVIGANGSGKSNLVDFFRLGNALTRLGGLREFAPGTADAYVYGGPERTAAIRARLAFGPAEYEFQLLANEDGFFLTKGEVLRDESLDVYSYLANGGFDSALSKGWQSVSQAGPAETLRVISRKMSEWRIYHVHDTGSDAGMRRYHDVGWNTTLFGDARNCAAFLFHLRKINPICYQTIREMIQLALPFFDDFVFQPTHEELIRLNWKQKGLNDYVMRPSQLSDGSMRFICLAVALLQPSLPSTLVIDEPELGLHPHAIALLAEMITHASLRTQVIVMTQSASLINHFAIDDIIVSSRKEGASVFQRLSAEDYAVWLEDYQIGELWERNIIPGGLVHD